MLNYQRVPPWPERSEFVFRFNLYEQLKLLQLRKFKSCNNFWTRLGWMMIDLMQLYLAFRVCLWPVACNVLFHGFHCFSIFFNIQYWLEKTLDLLLYEDQCKGYNSQRAHLPRKPCRQRSFYPLTRGHWTSCDSCKVLRRRWEQSSFWMT